MKLLITFWLGYALGWGSFEVSPNASLVDLFQIARSKDTKTIQYRLRLAPDGSIDTASPLDIFWEIQTPKGTKTQKLSWIQNTYAYGIEVINITHESLNFHFVSYDKKEIQVQKNSKGEYQAHIICNNTELLLEKIFIQIDGGTFWVPKISSVKLEGKDLQTGRSTFEIIKP